MVPFLARFVEPMIGALRMGTQTGTRTTEDPDSDEHYPSRMHALGTRTITETGGETADEDVQVALGTQTMTKVTNEDTDADRGVDAYGIWEVQIL